MKREKLLKELTIYFALTIGVSWAIFFLAVLKSKELLAASISSSSLVAIGTFMPSVIALLLCYIMHGKGDVRSLLKRALLYKFSKMWYLYIFLLMPGAIILSFILTKAITEVRFNSVLLPMLSHQPLLIVPIFLYMLALQGPLGEELGWRGFALDRLLHLWNPLYSSVILGLIWTLWHLPLFFINGTIQYEIASGGFAITFVGYFIYTTMLTILITILYIKTNRSILAVLLFHTMSNLSHGLITILTSLYGGLGILIIMFLVTCTVVICNRKFFLTTHNYQS